MEPFKLEKKDDSFEITRFLSKDGLLKTLGLRHCSWPKNNLELNPTFLFTSLESYRLLEDGDCRKDAHENRIISIHPETQIFCTSENVNPILVSCWTLYQESEIQAGNAFSVFKGSIAAIKSTVGDVKNIISMVGQNRNENGFSHAGNHGSLCSNGNYHGKVIYYSPDEHERIQLSSSVLHCFFKRREIYLKENEYRFIILFANHMHYSPESYCIRFHATAYIKKIYLKREGISDEETSEDKITKNDLKKIDTFYPGALEIM